MTFSFQNNVPDKVPGQKTPLTVSVITGTQHQGEESSFHHILKEACDPEKPKIHSSSDSHAFLTNKPSNSIISPNHSLPEGLEPGPRPGGLFTQEEGAGRGGG